MSSKILTPEEVAAKKAYMVAYHLRTYVRLTPRPQKGRCPQGHVVLERRSNGQCEVCARAKEKRQHSVRRRRPIERMWKSMKKSARTRGIIRAITKADLRGLLPTHCPVLGIELDYSHGTKGGKMQPNSPSVDRIDSTKGYVPGNIAVISARANTLKSNATIHELRRLVRYMEDRLPEVARQVEPLPSNIRASYWLTGAELGPMRDA